LLKVIATGEKGESKMRDSFIELLKQADKYASGVCTDYDEAQEVCAEYLLSEGVIVPPCKVGQTVYFPMETNGECEPYVDVGTVFAIGIDERHTMWISVRYESGLRYYHTSDDFGKTVFLTREEAERALERSENGKS
jgi:hypothetical protein